MKYCLIESNRHLRRMRQHNRLAERMLIATILLCIIGAVTHPAPDAAAVFGGMFAAVSCMWWLLRTLHREEERSYERTILRARLNGEME